MNKSHYFVVSRSLSEWIERLCGREILFDGMLVEQMARRSAEGMVTRGCTFVCAVVVAVVVVVAACAVHVEGARSHTLQLHLTATDTDDDVPSLVHHFCRQSCIPKSSCAARVLQPLVSSAAYGSLMDGSLSALNVTIPPDNIRVHVTTTNVISDIPKQ